ncbi:MAG: hypothetical protein QNJ30_10940 [Kiloniellales bacterium]|nr:hypothetical protein [Kiloniellales bacterium]
MASVAKQGQTLRRQRIPRRRFTGWALLYFAVFFCLPLLTLALLLDLALYLVFDRFFDACYGLLCLFG